MKVKSGFITLLGLPNAGKSSFFNKLIGEELAIVSPRAQTTWVSMRGFYSSKDCELVIYDTPGLQEGTKALNQAICRNAIQVLRNAKQGNELVAVVIDPVEIILSKKNKNLSQIERIPEIIRSNGVNIPMKLKIVPTIMKSDLIRNEKEKMIVDELVTNIIGKISLDYTKPIWVSNVKQSGHKEWMEVIKNMLPTSNSGELFNQDDLTDKNMRDIVSEYIREGCYYLLNDELPYSIAIEIESFDEKNPKRTKISAILHVEKNSQKMIVIGKKGEKIKQIGIRARLKIQKLLGKNTHLDLRVKVTPQWASKKTIVNKFGYEER